MVILEAVNMIFINQLDYPELEFVHNTKAETAPPERGRKSYRMIS